MAHKQAVRQEEIGQMAGGGAGGYPGSSCSSLKAASQL